MFRVAYETGPRMYTKKFEKARYVAAGVLFRYRRMHQGGQSEGVDPCPSPESFRAWLLQIHGLELSSEQWTREWEDSFSPVLMPAMTSTRQRLCLSLRR